MTAATPPPPSGPPHAPAGGRYDRPGGGPGGGPGDGPAPGLLRRPRLAPAIRRLWRDPQTLQLGSAPGALVLAGLTGPQRPVLGLLDGTRDRRGVLADAAAAGCPPAEVGALLQALAAAGALDDAAAAAPAAGTRAERDRQAPEVAALRLAGRECAAVLRRRAAARVTLHGAGRLGAPLAALLAASGVGHLDVVDAGVVQPQDCAVGGLGPADVGARRDERVRRLLAALAPSVRTGPVAGPHLVVLAPAAGAALPDRLPDLPHLLVRTRDGHGVVGPLVLPGVSACLHCLDLHRADRDPGWPALAVQLACPWPEVVPSGAALAAAVAAQAAAEVLAQLDGRSVPASLGGTLELAPGAWRWRRRSWQVHPDCRCGWAAAG